MKFWIKGGEWPIISYQHIQESNGLNDKHEFKRAPNIYQNQPLNIDPEDLIDIFIQETFNTSTGKE